MDPRSRHYQHEVSSSGSDEVEGLDSWSEDESESEGESESESESEDATEHGNEQKCVPKKRGWYGHEDDLFKDSDSDQEVDEANHVYVSFDAEVCTRM